MCGGRNKFGFILQNATGDKIGFVGLLPMFLFDGFADGGDSFHRIASVATGGLELAQLIFRLVFGAGMFGREAIERLLFGDDMFAGRSQRENDEEDCGGDGVTIRECSPKNARILLEGERDWNVGTRSKCMKSEILPR